MLGNGEEEKEAIRPDFNKSIFIDFAGANLTSDAGFLIQEEVQTRRYAGRSGRDGGYRWAGRRQDGVNGTT